MPDYIAKRLFDIVEVGFPVTITYDLEPEFPLREVLVQYAPYNSWYLAKEKVLGMIEKNQNGSRSPKPLVEARTLRFDLVNASFADIGVLL